MEHLNIIDCIIQGGSVGVAVLTLLVLYRLLCIGSSLMDNHLIHIYTALTSLNEKLDRLISVADRANRRVRAQEKKRVDEGK